jgi:uncharacterized Zn finger protein (UPF0148 family)
MSCPNCEDKNIQFLDGYGWEVECPDEYGSILINFCPFCGHDLQNATKGLKAHQQEMGLKIHEVDPW